jgi:hypothetical protein
MLGPTRISGIDRERMGQAAKHESQVRQTEREVSCDCLIHCAGRLD